MPPKTKPKTALPTGSSTPRVVAVMNKGGRPKGMMLEDSLPVRMLNTQVGSCQAIATSIPFPTSTQKQVSAIKGSTINTLRTASVRAAQKEPYMTWVFSTNDYRDQAGNLVIVAVATRIA